MSVALRLGGFKRGPLRRANPGCPEDARGIRSQADPLRTLAMMTVRLGCAAAREGYPVSSASPTEPTWLFRMSTTGAICSWILTACIAAGCLVLFPALSDWKGARYSAANANVVFYISAASATFFFLVSLYATFVRLTSKGAIYICGNVFGIFSQLRWRRFKLDEALEIRPGKPSWVTSSIIITGSDGVHTIDLAYVHGSPSEVAYRLNAYRSV